MRQSLTRFLSNVEGARPTWVTGGSLSSVAGVTLYNQVFSASSPISAPVSYSVVGSLPTGLSLVGDTVSGIVTNPSADETRTFTLQAATGTLTKPQTFSLPVTKTTLADPYAESVVFLYNFNSSYNDTSVYARHLVTGGTTSSGGTVTTQKKYGSGSLYFNGATAGINVNVRVPPSSALLIPASTDFCFEFWMRADLPQSFGCMMVSGAGVQGSTGSTEITNGINIGNWTGTSGATGSGTARTSLSVFLGGTQLWTTSNPNDSAWHHVAVVRNSGTLTLYWDGVAQGPTPTYTGPVDFGQTYGFRLGRFVNHATNNIYIGYLDDMRLTVGVPRYTTGFTAPTAEAAYP